MFRVASGQTLRQSAGVIRKVAGSSGIDGNLITVACHEDLTGSDLVGRYLIKGKGYYEMLLRAVAKSHRIPIEKKAFEDLKPEHKDLILYGKGAREQSPIMTALNTAARFFSRRCQASSQGDRPLISPNSIAASNGSSSE